MITRMIKYGIVGAVGVVVLTGALFGRDAASYLHSSAKSVQTAVKDAVPIEFELRRARDLLEEIIPEMHANVRLIAAEEVEIESLKADIHRSQRELSEQKQRVAVLRDAVAAEHTTYSFDGRQYSFHRVKEELARNFDRLKEAQVVLAGKKRLLQTRENSLDAAVKMLEQTRTRKVQLESQIQALASQYRLVKAASAGSRVQIDHSKLAQTEKLIRQIKKRLDVAERVLAHDSRFVEPMAIDVINEAELLQEVDAYLTGDAPAVGDTDQAEVVLRTNAEPAPRCEQ